MWPRSILKVGRKKMSVVSVWLSVHRSTKVYVFIQQQHYFKGIHFIYVLPVLPACPDLIQFCSTVKMVRPAKTEKRRVWNISPIWQHLPRRRRTMTILASARSHIQSRFSGRHTCLVHICGCYQSISTSCCLACLPRPSVYWLSECLIQLAYLDLDPHHKEQYNTKH